MTQPDGCVDSARPSHVCNLHKALYGLKQAPRVRFDKLKQALFDFSLILNLILLSFIVARMENCFLCSFTLTIF